MKRNYSIFGDKILMFKNVSHIPEEQLSAIKTKLHRTYESYCSIHVPHNYKESYLKAFKKQRYYNNEAR